MIAKSFIVTGIAQDLGGAEDSVVHNDIVQSDIDAAYRVADAESEVDSDNMSIFDESSDE